MNAKYIEIYKQIKKSLLENQPEDKPYKLPGVRELAKIYNTSTLTISKSLTLLKKENLISSVWAQGNYVVPNNYYTPKKINNFAQILLLCDITKFNSPQNVLYREIIPVLNKYFFKKNYFLNIAPGVSEAFIENLIKNKKITGIILIHDINPKITSILSKYKIPVVEYFSNKKHYNFSLVKYNLEDAINKIIHILLKKKRKHFAVISIKKKDNTFYNRVIKFIDSLNINKIKISKKNILTHSYINYNINEIIKIGSNLTEKLLITQHNIDVIFCQNDALAIGAYQTLKKHKIKIGKDISVIGFDNIEISKYTIPPITTIYPNYKTIAIEGAKLLEDKIKNTNNIAIKEISAELILRDSH